MASPFIHSPSIEYHSILCIVLTHSLNCSCTSTLLFLSNSPCHFFHYLFHPNNKYEWWQYDHQPQTIFLFCSTNFNSADTPIIHFSYSFHFNFHHAFLSQYFTHFISKNIVIRLFQIQKAITKYFNTRTILFVMTYNTRFCIIIFLWLNTDFNRCCILLQSLSPKSRNCAR